MTTNKQPLISIIIANYNGELYLPTCLTSLLKTSYPDFEVLVIDDGSTDKSVQIVEQFGKKDKRISFICNKKNIGAAASRNRAVTKAKGGLLVFLDNDTEVDPAWLKEIVVTMSKYQNIGGCQAVLYDFKKRTRIQNAGVKLWAATGWGLPHDQWEKDTGQLKKIENIIAISAALAVKKNVFLQIGGFDEDEAVVTEDLDFSWRIWLTGKQIMLSPRSKVYHWTKSISMRSNMKHTKQKIYYHLTKNALMSILKNYEIGNAIKYFFSCLCISYGRALLALIRRKETEVFLGTLQGTVYVLFHIIKISQKRSKIQQIRRFTDHDLFGKVIVQESLISIYHKYFSQSNLL